MEKVRIGPCRVRAPEGTRKRVDLSITLIMNMLIKLDLPRRVRIKGQAKTPHAGSLIQDAPQG